MSVLLLMDLPAHLPFSATGTAEPGCPDHRGSPYPPQNPEAGGAPRTSVFFSCKLSYMAILSKMEVANYTGDTHIYVKKE